MERSIPRLLLILVLFILPTPPFAATSGLKISKVVHVSSLKDWWRARWYCRAHYTDLVTIRNSQDVDELALFEGWIGLNRNSEDIWEWTKGSEIVSFTNWDIGEPDGNRKCVLTSQKKWANDDCSSQRPFLCVDERLILVQEMKTWEEALLHCRGLQAEDSTQQYDIASLPEVNNTLLDRETIGEAATNEVWVGLRFLAGQWLWVSGEGVTSSYLPHCPAQGQHCGALESSNNNWKIMDCSEKRNFICSIV